LTRSEKYRQAICEIGRKVYSAGYVAANDGNISVRLDDETVLITPTGVSKGAMRPGGIAEIDLSGNNRGRCTPSSEVRMHLAIYRCCPDIYAVIHTHPPYATAWAVTGRDLSEPILPEVIATIGKIPLLPYRAPSTQELADLVGEAATGYDVMLLQNHGLVAVGADLDAAYYKTERAEHAFKILTIARTIGEAKLLSPAQIRELLALYNVPDRVRKMY